MIATTILAFLLGGATFAAGFYVRAKLRAADVADSFEEEPLEPAMAWRKLKLACGDGYQHPEACCALQALRIAGYDVRMDGNDRLGYADIEITHPTKREAR